MRHPKYSHAFEVVSELPAPLRSLKKLAFNFLWTWRSEFRDLFREIDKAQWDADHNPVQLISTLTPERLRSLAADKAFLSRLADRERDLDEYLAGDTWFGRLSGQSDDQIQIPKSEVQNASIAYFCAEFGISEGLPIYSGGLGVLAGDHLKAASDLGLPLVGVGLLYARGYFRQRLSPDGWQQEHYPAYDFYQMPLRLMHGQDEQPIRIEVEMPDRTVTCQVWRADVGRVPLYLLDSNVLENEPTDQGITDTLYGGDEEMRIQQEIILGVGGMRALRALGIKPTVCHMNEGHAAFLAIERIRQYMEEHGCDFRTGRQACVNGNVFTTHTPVPAGFDVFPKSLLEEYTGKLASSVGLTVDQLVRMGRINPDIQDEPFNMAILAMENANHVNGVSKLHASVTRGMFGPRWPQIPESEVPIDAVTNGIHTKTWICRRMALLFDRYLGPEWSQADASPEVWARAHAIPDQEMWAIRENQRGDLVRFVRKRLQSDIEKRNAGRVDFATIGTVLDPRILTIGFARRFATYKRATLLLEDRDRLKQLLFHADRPIQIVFAGKSHPRDDGGKKLIQDLFNFIHHEGALTRMVFIEDYDMGVARALVQGVDVWLNNPMRPQEASGTSGMKVVPNGGLNCSILDGWWDEGFQPGVGWAIGDRDNPAEGEHQDWLDSRSLYQLIESEIAPKFYHRVDGGIPTAWIEMMKRSIADLGPFFSTARMVQDYATKCYLPAHIAFTNMNGDAALKAIAWRERVKQAWPKVRVVQVTDTASSTNALGEEFCIKAIVDLGSLTPNEVRVQAFVGQIGPNRDLVNAQPVDLELFSDPPLSPMNGGERGQGGEGSGQHVFQGSIACAEAGHRGYTVRILPRHDLVDVAHELPLAAWE
ncbi:MAG: alpha-glucan family phosphorylase [Fimbriimonadaceae bacterium]